MNTAIIVFTTLGITFIVGVVVASIAITAHENRQNNKRSNYMGPPRHS